MKERKSPATKKREDSIKKQQENNKREEDKLIASFYNLFDNPDGERFLKWLHQQCGYDMPSIVVDPQSHEINNKMTIYNEARRNVWMQLRKLLKKETLIKVEYNDD